MAEWELWITDKEREALKDSIENWEGVVEGERRQSCALCSISNYECNKCPVGVWSGDGCENTPYLKWDEAGMSGDKKAEKRAAKKELAFLKDLLKRAKSL